MRAALQSVASIVANWALDLGPNSAAQRDYKKLEHALSSNAGKDYFHRDEFKILVEALREIEAHPDARHQIVQVCKRTIAAAHEKGIIS